MENTILKKEPFFVSKKIEYFTDPLTKLLNREIVFEYAKNLISEKIPFSMLICDIDNFKYVNDSFGHIVGDHVLEKVAQNINEQVKNYGIAGRFGGDEFVIIVPNVIGYDDVWNICRDITISTNNIPFEELEGFNISFTVGTSRFDQDGKELDELLTKADKALYRGKQKGRNCFIIYLKEKHENIELKTAKDLMFSSMDMHAQIINILTYSSSLLNNIKSLLKYLCNQLMIDCVSIQSLERVNCFAVYALSKGVECKYVSSNKLTKNFNSYGLSFANNIKQLLVIKQNDLYEELKEKKVFSFVACKIEGYGKMYGYLRADCPSPDGRIWQTNDMDLFIVAAKLIGILLHNFNLDLDTLFPKTIKIKSEG